MSGVRFCSSIGYSIAREKWDSDAMKVKHGAVNARKVPYNLINSRISAITSSFDELEAHNAKMSKFQIKEHLAKLVGRTARGAESDDTDGSNVPFFKHWDEFILDGKTNHKWSLNTVKKWGTLQRHVTKFNPSITLDDWNKATLDHYVQFGAQENQMLDVSIRKELSLLRWYLG